VEMEEDNVTYGYVMKFVIVFLFHIYSYNVY